MDAFCGPISDRISLEEMANKYDITTKTLHNALYDAYITAQIFQKQIWQLQKYGVENLKDLVYISKKGGDM